MTGAFSASFSAGKYLHEVERLERIAQEPTHQKNDLFGFSSVSPFSPIWPE